MDVIISILVDKHPFILVYSWNLLQRFSIYEQMISILSFQTSHALTLAILISRFMTLLLDARFKSFLYLRSHAFFVHWFKRIQELNKWNTSHQEVLECTRCMRNYNASDELKCDRQWLKEVPLLLSCIQHEKLISNLESLINLTSLKITRNQMPYQQWFSHSLYNTNISSIRII